MLSIKKKIDNMLIPFQVKLERMLRIILFKVFSVIAKTVSRSTVLLIKKLLLLINSFFIKSSIRAHGSFNTSYVTINIFFSKSNILVFYIFRSLYATSRNTKPF